MTNLEWLNTEEGKEWAKQKPRSTFCSCCIYKKMHDKCYNFEAIPCIYGIIKWLNKEHKDDKL